uniref:NADH dehydrogenase subunit 2 n=1 Tax=Tetranychus truncatus TaxID=93132 RepID=A0A0U1X9X5_9ACAR|nr:NADH dehydrogenase subunit 2 [Tetranychus truncatus]AIM52006.1 NADH dehydrogenase subunit 2 [Tetranychus truncatus]AUT13622.1 NADH dehydrogenase subunit 2 [Tetranychus truncatus]AUT13635.1 NADH dehydrogenase subunit 2 [Tetranychus truncatus]AUT13648.1 NADH dehydrogenase subunit 2 [Tetranychus truncatus]AUT13661.1 NADH dehydrogenase subunit 2 [Tetranychus truncatus]
MLNLLVMYYIMFIFMVFLYSNMIMIWFFMEMSSMIFYIMLNKLNNNKEINIIYFIIQEMSSIMMIYMYMINNLFLLNFFILLKMGVPPMHNWLLKISIFLNWKILYMVMNFQKIIPLNFIYMYMCNSWSMMIMLNLFMTTFFLFNALNNKYLYSIISLNSLSWIILLMFFNKMFMLIYMFFYFFFNFFFLKEFMNLNSKNFFNILTFKMLFFFILLNMISFPPTIMFFLKIKIIFLLKYYNLTKFMLISLIIIMLVFSTMFFMFFLNHFFVTKWNKEKINMKLNMIIYFNLMLMFL